MYDFKNDPRFKGIEPFKSKVWLSSPTMHGDEQRWVDEAIRTNWVSTVGENINVVEEQVAEKVGRKFAVALSSGTAALHLAIRLCGEKLYGQAPVGHGTLDSKRVFASDMTFDATVNPICYEGGTPIFIDTEYDTWNGTPGKVDEIRAIADKHGALIVEDAAESFGATYKGIQTGCFGEVSILSGNGNKIITGSSGGFLLTESLEDANKVRKWSTQSREDATWYQHEELGYNYRMSNIIAGIIRGQFPYLEEHIEQKRAIYEWYKEELKGLPVKMNPYDEGEPGKSCPGEILAAIAAFNAEGRPIWKPMHMQPIYRTNPFVTVEGNGRGRTNAYISGSSVDVGADIFRRGLCLPSDNKMTPEQQDRIIEIIHRCFL